MCQKTLPQNYKLHDKIDLKDNKKHFWIVQLIGIAIMVVMIIAGCFIVKPTELYEYISDTNNLKFTLSALAVLIVGYVLYIIAHEAVHGLFMYAFVKTKIKFGFIGWAAYAGSTAYYDKKHYIIIALAPAVVWGIVFGVLNAIFHSGIWFWVIWFLQMGNLSGAAGDFFCAYKMTTYPKDILVNDSGVNMQVFRRMTDEELAEAENAESDINEQCGEEKVD